MKTKMYKTHRCKLLPWVTSVCCMCFLISVPAYGEDEEESIVTDRPDVAESSLTVPSGRVQVETGADLTLTETNLSGTDVSNRNIEFPTKIRVGITPFLELHLESGVATLSKQESNFDALDSELEIDSVPIDIGGKVHLIDLDGWQPSLGILFALTVPTAGD